MEETNEEKIKRLKEEELKELKKRKAFLEQVKQAQKMQSLHKAMNELENMLQNDDTQEWMDKLNHQTIENEIKIEMALEKHKTSLSEEEIMQENAKKLLEIMKKSNVANSEEKPTHSLTLGDQEFNSQDRTISENQDISTKQNDSPKSII
ncbi:MAG: hypothetical protein NZ455_07035 [Bacteroidia bacterium]|nr:hypothetical protein [Bacteroidia bacterium]